MASSEFIGLQEGGGGSGDPAGSSTQVQFNDSGSFGASSHFKWDGTALTVDSASPSAGTVGLDVSGLDARFAIEPNKGEFLLGYTSSAALLRMWNGSGVEKVNLHSNGASYLNGGTVTIDNVKASVAGQSNLLFASDVGLLQSIATVYNPAFDGTGGEATRPAVVTTGAGLAATYTRTSTTTNMGGGALNVVAKWAPTGNVASTVDLTTAKVVFKVDASVANTVGLGEALDVLLSHDSTAAYAAHIGMSSVTQVTAGATGSIGLLAGAFTIVQTDAAASTPIMVGLKIDSTDGGSVTNRGTVSNYYRGLHIAGMSTSAMTVANRAAIYIDAMPGTTSTTDYTLYSAATQPSYMVGGLALGGGGASGVLSLVGSSSGVVGITTAAAAGTWTFTLPTSGGTDGFFLKTNGSGTSSWALVPSMIAGTAYAATVTGSTTSYLAFSGQTVVGVEAVKNIIVPCAGTISKFYVSVGTQPAGGDLVLTVRKNGAGTAITKTHAAGATPAVISDLTHSFTVAAGDVIALEAANGSSSASAPIVGFSVLLTP